MPDPTVIEDDVKAGSFTHIVANCVVKKGSIAIECAELGGFMRVGQHNWPGLTLS